ncbi:MAG: hypothetical protein FWH51_06105 [Dehalococcoidia bacterium]|nr:hypothetical protein [Dehalococcoidia bacterium]
MKKYLIAIVAIVAVIAIAWCGTYVWNNYLNTPLVEYKIEGTAQSVLVGTRNSDGTTEYSTGVALPHSYKYNKFEGDTVSVWAQNEGESGSVKVSIYYDGKLVGSDASAGPFVTAEVTCPLPVLTRLPSGSVNGTNLPGPTPYIDGTPHVDGSDNGD